eukprot:3965961-Alexandrium_andersonii.AAC.1
MKYIWQQRRWTFVGWCGGKPEGLSLQVFADADFASDIPTARSTSGGAVKLVGALIVSCLSKIQSSVSHSTPEAEIVALDQVVRTMAFPARDLWEAILKRTVAPTLEEDNAACVTV